MQPDIQTLKNNMFVVREEKPNETVEMDSKYLQSVNFKDSDRKLEHDGVQYESIFKSNESN